MKKIISIFTISVIISLFSLQAYPWGDSYTGTTNDLLSATEYLKPNFGYPGSILWVCGNAGTIKKSLPPYSSWSDANFGIPSSVTLVNIFAADSNNVFTIGYLGSTAYLYKTTNAGSNWSQIFTQVNGHFNGVWMRNANTGILIGDPVNGRWSIWRTINGGLNWDSTGRYLAQNGIEHGWNNSLWAEGDSLWFGTNNSRIYYSSNYGLNWVVRSTAPEVNIYTLHFLSYSDISNQGCHSNTGWAGGSNYLLETTNSGINWTVVTPNVPGNGNIMGIAEANPGVDLLISWVIYVIRSNKVYYYNPWGNIWVTDFTAPSGTFNYMVKSRNMCGGNMPWWNNYLIAIRTGGYISWCGCGWGEVKKISSVVPVYYALYQNYPNPFNPVTKIKFDILTPLSSFGEGQGVRLVIYNILGQEVTTLVNEELQAGTYEVEWNGANQPSGVYFYKLTTTDYSDTKSMVLIK